MAEGSRLRLDLGQVIQMMQGQAPQGVVIQGAKEWPPIAWVVLQAEAGGADRGELATQLGVGEDDLVGLIETLIQAPSPEVTQEVWQVGIICLKTASIETNQVLATTWDQVEAMAIEKLATAIQSVAGANVDPMKLANLAKIANSAIRRQAGEGSGRSAPGGGMGIDLEMQSGELGSIRLRLSPRVIEQMSNPGKVIDSVVNRTTPVQTRDMLRLKEIRPIAEALDSEADKAAHAKAAESLIESKLAGKAKADDKMFGDMSKLVDLMQAKP